MCIQPMQFVKKYRMPVRVVRLDTEYSRKLVQSGRHFQIKSVPSLVINYADGNMQLFIGSDKILQILTTVKKQYDGVKNTHYPNEMGIGNGDINESGESFNIGNMYERNDGGTSSNGTYNPQTKFIPVKPSYAARPSVPRSQNNEEPSRKNTPIVYEDDEEDEEIIPNNTRRSVEPKRPAPRVLEINNGSESDEGHSDIEETHEPVKKPKAKKAKAKTKSKAKKGKKKQPPVIFEENDVDDERSPTLLDHPLTERSPTLLDQQQDEEIIIEASPSQKRGVVKQKSKMKSIIDKAQQLEADRKYSLGYEESDLPHYY